MVRSRFGVLQLQREQQLAEQQQQRMAMRSGWMTTPRGISTAATLDHAQEAKAAVQLQRGQHPPRSRARPAWTATPRGHSPASMTGQEPETTAARAHHPSGPSAIRRYRPLQRPAWPTAHPLGRVAHPSSTRAPSSSCVDHGRTCSPQWFHQTRDQPPSEWTPRNGQDPYRGHMERTHEKQASHAQPPHLDVEWSFIRPDTGASPSARDHWRPPRPGDWYEYNA